MNRERNGLAHFANPTMKNVFHQINALIARYCLFEALLFRQPVCRPAFLPGADVDGANETVQFYHQIPRLFVEVCFSSRQTSNSCRSLVNVPMISLEEKKFFIAIEKDGQMFSQTLPGSCVKWAISCPHPRNYAGGPAV